MLYSQSTEKHDCIILFYMLFYKKEMEIAFISSICKNVLVYCCKYCNPIGYASRYLYSSIDIE